MGQGRGLGMRGYVGEMKSEGAGGEGRGGGGRGRGGWGREGGGVSGKELGMRGEV